MAVQAVKKIMTNIDDQNVNLRMIKIVKKLGETVDVSQLIDGALIEQNSMGHGGPSRVEKAKIGLIQFQISPPKTNVCFLRVGLSVKVVLMGRIVLPNRRTKYFSISDVRSFPGTDNPI